MSKKPSPLEAAGNIMAAFQSDAAPPSPAPAAMPRVAKSKQGEPGKGGRPAIGKRSDPETYCQTSIWIRKETRTLVKHQLLDSNEAEDMSELVELLFQRWLAGDIKVS
jgi:hypothetical protein